MSRKLKNIDGRKSGAAEGARTVGFFIDARSKETTLWRAHFQ
jgi:hypothetical protein